MKSYCCHSTVFDIDQFGRNRMPGKIPEPALLVFLNLVTGPFDLKQSIGIVLKYDEIRQTTSVLLQVTQHPIEHR